MDLSSVIQSMFTFSNNLKLYHWNTQSYARHKASDSLSGSFASFVDKFVETAIATYGRPTFADSTSVGFSLWSDDDAITELQNMRAYLINDLGGMLDTGADVDLFNLRDDIVANINQTLYLFTFA